MIGYKDQLPPALKQQIYNKEEASIKEDFFYENIFEQDLMYQNLCKIQIFLIVIYLNFLM